MNTAKTVVIAALAAVSFGLAGCSNTLEGTYALDKDDLKNAMRAERAKLGAPPLSAERDNLASARVDTMEMTIELLAGGKLKSTFTYPTLQPPTRGRVETKQGTWKIDGESVVLRIDRRSVKCSRSWAKLSCDPGEKGDPKLIFVKS